MANGYLKGCEVKHRAFCERGVSCHTRLGHRFARRGRGRTASIELPIPEERKHQSLDLDNPGTMKVRRTASHGTTVCRFWQRGKCRRGRKCAFRHGDEGWPTPAEANCVGAGLGLGPGLPDIGMAQIVGELVKLPQSLFIHGMEQATQLLQFHLDEITAGRSSMGHVEVSDLVSKGIRALATQSE